MSDDESGWDVADTYTRKGHKNPAFPFVIFFFKFSVDLEPSLSKDCKARSVCDQGG